MTDKLANELKALGINEPLKFCVDVWNLKKKHNLDNGNLLKALRLFIETE